MRDKAVMPFCSCFVAERVFPFYRYGVYAQTAGKSKRRQKVPFPPLRSAQRYMREFTYIEAAAAAAREMVQQSESSINHRQQQV